MSLLEIEKLDVRFDTHNGLFGKRSVVRAVNAVSFDIVEGETFGLVGESGCGKSSLARTIVGLNTPTSGLIRYRGEVIRGQGVARNAKTRALQREIQMIFQDPRGALNPWHAVGDSISEIWRAVPGLLDRSKWESECRKLMDTVGLDPYDAHKFPHQFSGGQLQRVGIARALAAKPSVIICDEAVSALDVSIQAQIINLLMAMQSERGLTLLFIGHDLPVVGHISDRIGVMYLGRLVEVSEVESLFNSPRHPYSRLLLASAPDSDANLALAADERSRALHGDLPSPTNLPKGCAFHPRCWRSGPECALRVPNLLEEKDGRHLACFHPLGVDGVEVVDTAERASSES